MNNYIDVTYLGSGAGLIACGWMLGLVINFAFGLIRGMRHLG